MEQVIKHNARKLRFFRENLKEVVAETSEFLDRLVDEQHKTYEHIVKRREAMDCVQCKDINHPFHGLPACVYWTLPRYLREDFEHFIPGLEDKAVFTYIPPQPQGKFNDRGYWIKDD